MASSAYYLNNRDHGYKGRARINSFSLDTVLTRRNEHWIDIQFQFVSNFIYYIFLVGWNFETDVSSHNLPLICTMFWPFLWYYFPYLQVILILYYIYDIQINIYFICYFVAPNSQEFWLFFKNDPYLIFSVISLFVIIHMPIILVGLPELLWWMFLGWHHSGLSRWADMQ